MNGLKLMQHVHVQNVFPLLGKGDLFCIIWFPLLHA